AGGGYVAMLTEGIPQRWVAQAAYEYERQVAAGERIRVGVNRYQDEDELAPPVFEVDEAAAERQRRALTERLSRRDQQAVAATLAALAADLREGRNCLPGIMTCARAGATLGEIADTMRSCFGEYEEPPPW